MVLHHPPNLCFAIRQRLVSLCVTSPSADFLVSRSCPSLKILRVPHGSIRRGGKGGGGLGPKWLCTKKGPIRFSQLQISFFPTMVTLVLVGGGSREG